MSSSPGWLCCCCSVLLVVLVVLVRPGSAARDEQFYDQRDVTFDLDQIMQEMQQPESLDLQKEVDLSELLDPKEFPIEQVMVSPPDFNRGRPNFGPRSFGGPPILQYPVQFPLARPTPNNLQAICRHGDHRPRYNINSYFPASGFGQLKRKAEAVNNAESWFDVCCRGNQTWETEVTLCCATQAWELFVETFCSADSSVKDRLYDCCRMSGSDRLDCFNRDAPNTNYGATEELPVTPIPSTVSFSFDQNTCQRVQMSSYTSRAHRKKKEKKVSPSGNVDIIFPPGRPSADALDSLCGHQKLRPLYHTRCLPRSGFEWLARQAKTVNRIEKGYRQCCKKKTGVLSCVDQKWREELDRFCLSDSFSCCLNRSSEDRFSCFHSRSADPHYNQTAPPEEPSLSSICDTHKDIDRRFPVGFPLKPFVKQCCPLPEEQRTACSAQRLEETSKKLCSSGGRSPPTVRQCCKLPSQETPQCIHKILLSAVNKAANALRQKHRKKCPLS